MAAAIVADVARNGESRMDLFRSLGYLYDEFNPTMPAWINEPTV